MPDALHGAGIGYVHLATLGGRRTKSKCVEEDTKNAGWERWPFHNYADYAATAPFEEGLRSLLGMVSRETCAIMCAEAVWWRCHRRIVTDHVLAHGVPVIHLVGPGNGDRASLTPFAVVGANSRVSYPPQRAIHVHGAEIARSARMLRSAFRIGDHVSWNSEAGRVKGVIKKKLVAPTKLKGYTVRTSEEGAPRTSSWATRRATSRCTRGSKAAQATQPGSADACVNRSGAVFRPIRVGTPRATGLFGRRWGSD